MVDRGEKPAKKASGTSEKDFMKPEEFFWRKRRRIKASEEVAVTLQ
jgi:hypothetical protein